jgi:hypothetical protein
MCANTAIDASAWRMEWPTPASTDTVGARGAMVARNTTLARSSRMPLQPCWALRGSRRRHRGAYGEERGVCLIFCRGTREAGDGIPLLYKLVFHVCAAMRSGSVLPIHKRGCVRELG